MIYVATQLGGEFSVELYDSQGKLVKSAIASYWVTAFEFTGLQGEYFLKFTPLVAYSRYSFGVNASEWDDAL